MPVKARTRPVFLRVARADGGEIVITGCSQRTGHLSGLHTHTSDPNLALDVIVEAAGNVGVAREQIRFVAEPTTPQ